MNVQYDGCAGSLAGEGVVTAVKTVGQLKGVFLDERARAALPQDRVAYRVQSHCPVPEGSPGGLFFGISAVEAGTVGNEFFMTRGHLHAKADCGEYYWGIGGSGLLLLMNKDRSWRAERVVPKSLHYIPGHVAHRLVNTGAQPLIVGACWPSDAGHDYATIAREGFSIRAMRGPGGEVQLVKESGR